MSHKELRPFPVHKQVLFRSALFALARIGAEIHQYDEHDGLIIAAVKRIKIGKIEFIEQEAKVSVREYDQVSMLELVAPNAGELLRIISQYVVEGIKSIRDDAIGRWNEFLKEEESRRKKEETSVSRQQTLTTFLSNVPLLSKKKENAQIQAFVDPTPAPTTDKFFDLVNTSPVDQLPAISAPGTEVVVVQPTDDLIAIDPSIIQLKLPSEPGMLMRTRHKQWVEVRLEPNTHLDRGGFLQVCRECHATLLQGSLFCSFCGQALTLEAVVKHELQKKALKHANASFRFALFGLIPCLLFVLPPLISLLSTEHVSQDGISLLTLLIRSISITGSAMTPSIRSAIAPLFLVAIPMFLLGQKATAEGQKASQLLNMSFQFEKSGQKRSSLGQAIGWFNIYLALAFAALIIIPRFM